MNPLSPKFGGGATETILHPLVLIVMLLAVVLFFVLPRKYIIIPVLATTFLIPLGQVIYLGGVHLFVSRILILAAFIRAISSKTVNEKYRLGGGWNSVDTAFTAFVGLCAFATILNFPQMSAVVNQFGYLWDNLLGYFLLRMLIRNYDDGILAVKCLAWLMIVLACEAIVEQETMINLFGLLGGIRAMPESRNNAIRSQAVFQHTLTAGAFAAASVPLLATLWQKGKSRILSAISILAATVMTLATHASTSLLTEASGIMALCLWPIRRKMRWVRYALAAVFVSLAIVMKAPVWFAIAHIDLTGSSSSYQRAELIDQFIRHFSSWWLIGTPSTAGWGWDMWDVQNMFVSAGETGGLAALICFIFVVSKSFAKVGTARKRAPSKKLEWWSWCLGAALFANVIAFFGVDYFDQVKMMLFVLLSSICATSIRRAVPSTVGKLAEEEMPQWQVANVEVGHDSLNQGVY